MKGDNNDRGGTLQEVINRGVSSALRGLYTLIPAKVVKWDATKGRADCQPLVKDVYEDEEGERKAKSFAVVTGVPVQFIGAGLFRLTCPISDGNLQIDGAVIPATMGSLIFAHRSLDKWSTGTGGEVDPEFDHDHGENDAVFMPGLMPSGAPWSIPTDRATLGHDSGVQIHMHKDTMVLGKTETNAEQMALFETFLADMKSMVTTINTILLAGTTGGPTAQNIVQAAQFALTQMYIRLQADGIAYLSQELLNK